MPTGDQMVGLNDRQTLGITELKTLLFDYIDQLPQDVVGQLWDADGWWGSTPTLSSTVDDTITIQAGKTGTDGSGRLFETGVSGSAYDVTVPFQNASGVTYYVGLMSARIPTAVKTSALSGAKQYTAYREIVGNAAAPSVATDDGDGTMTFIVDSVTEAGVSHEGRQVMVWLNTPQSINPSIAFETLDVTWDGSNNVIETSAAFGQSTVSETEANYTVCLLGPRIERLTDLSGEDDVLFVGTVLGSGSPSQPSTFTLTGATTYQSGITTTQFSRLEALLDVARPGCYFGSAEAHAEYTLSGNVTLDDTGDPVTIEFASWATAATDWIFTGSLDGTLEKRICTVEGDVIASMPASSATGTYHVICDAYRATQTTYGVDFVIIPDADYTAEVEARCLKLCTLGYDNATTSWSAYLPDDLLQLRGIWDPRVLGADIEGFGQGLLADKIIGGQVGSSDQEIQFLLRNATSSTTDGIPRQVGKFDRPSDATSDFIVGDGAAMTNKTSKIRHSHTDDYEYVATDVSGTKTWALKAGGSDVITHARTGGASEDSTGVTKVQDLQLLGANGKQNWRQLDIWSGYGDTAERSSAPQVVASSAEIVVSDSVTLDDLLSGSDWSRSAYDVNVGTIFRFRAAGEVVSVNGTPDVSLYAKAAGTAWASAVGVAASSGLEFLLDADIVAHVATGAIIVHPRWGDAGGGTTPLGAAPLGVNMAGKTSVAWDSATALAFQLQAQWSAAHADNIIRCNYASLERLDSGNLWAKNVTAGGSQRWYCAVSNGKKINWQIAPPTGSAQNVEIEAVRVRARLNSAASGDKITLRLHTYSLPASGAGSLSSAIALTGGTGADYVDVTSGAFAWYTLTPTTPIVTSRLARVLVQAETVHASGAGSVPGFEIDGVEYQTTGREILW